MISEKHFIEQYKNFWDEIFPGITDYLRKINKTESTGEVKSSQKTSSLTGFTNDIAFRLFEEEIENGKVDMSPDSILSLYFEFKELHKYKYYDTRVGDDNLILDELNVINEIKNNLVARYKDKRPKSHPVFYGCGFQSEVYGDVLYGSTLAEVKARGKKSKNSKSAGFRSDDLIQLFIYGALYFSEQREERTPPRYGIVEYFELFNPRLGYVWREKVEVISGNISSSSATDVYDEIVRFLSYTNTSL